MTLAVSELWVILLALKITSLFLLMFNKQLFCNE